MTGKWIATTGVNVAACEKTGAETPRAVIVDSGKTIATRTGSDITTIAPIATDTWTSNATGKTIADEIATATDRFNPMTNASPAG